MAVKIKHGAIYGGMATSKPTFIGNPRGTVLILVLWVLAMLTIIGGYYAVEARIRRNLGQGAWNELQGREAVYSILRLSALKISPPPLETDDQEQETGLDQQGEELKIYADGRRYSVKFGDNRLEFSLRDESGKLSINKATENQLQELFTELLGEDQEDRVREITQSILDWRDADNIKRDDGAEDAWYEDQVPPYESPDRPFMLLDELLLVRGVGVSLYYGPLEWYKDDQAPEDGATPEWVGSLRDLLTVYNDSKGISVRYAAPLLESLFEGSTQGSSSSGKAVCLTLEREGTSYAVYWARQTNGRFGIIHWTEQGLPGRIAPADQE